MCEIKSGVERNVDVNYLYYFMVEEWRFSGGVNCNYYCIIKPPVNREGVFCRPRWPHMAHGSDFVLGLLNAIDVARETFIVVLVSKQKHRSISRSHATYVCGDAKWRRFAAYTSTRWNASGGSSFKIRISDWLYIHNNDTELSAVIK